MSWLRCGGNKKNPIEKLKGHTFRVTKSGMNPFDPYFNSYSRIITYFDGVQVSSRDVSVNMVASVSDTIKSDNSGVLNGGYNLINTSTGTYTDNYYHKITVTLNGYTLKTTSYVGNNVSIDTGTITIQ